jgi:hypothetical protein
MKSRTKRLVAAGLVVALLTGAAKTARADWEDVAVLLRIVSVLGEVRSTLARINDLVEVTKNTLANVYPDATMDEIRQIFYGVRSITEEIGALSCGWQFNNPVRRFFDGVLGGGARICKNEWRSMFGAPPPTYNADLEEYYDALGTLNANAVASRIREARKQHEFWDGLLERTRISRDADQNNAQSAGMAERYTALGVAGLGNVLVQQGESESLSLKLATMRFMHERMRRRLDTEMAVNIYASIADLEGAQ